jgi:hypothetical protein
MKTNREGAYQFSFLAPARYTLTVAHARFETEHRAVEVLLGPPESPRLSHDLRLIVLACWHAMQVL